MKDILQGADGDIKLVNGDIVWGDATRQHQRDILLARKGDYRTRPDVGVGLEDYLDDELSSGELRREIRVQFQKDGMKIKSLVLTDIKAHY